MRRLLIKYDSKIQNYLKLLNPYCLKEVSSNEHNCIIMILSEDGYLLCKNMIPNYIIKSSRVNLYDVIMYDEVPQKCRLKLKNIPYNELNIVSSRSEYMMDEDKYTIYVKSFLTDSEYEALKKLNDYIINKVRPILGCYCRSKIQNPNELTEYINKNLNCSLVYGINGFEMVDGGLFFNVHCDLNKLDTINKMSNIKIDKVNLFFNLY